MRKLIVKELCILSHSRLIGASFESAYWTHTQRHTHRDTQRHTRTQRSTPTVGEKTRPARRRLSGRLRCENAGPFSFAVRPSERRSSKSIATPGVVANWRSAFAMFPRLFVWFVCLFVCFFWYPSFKRSITANDIDEGKVAINANNRLENAEQRCGPSPVSPCAREAANDRKTIQRSL